jgi:hypothetical protein
MLSKKKSKVDSGYPAFTIIVVNDAARVIGSLSILNLVGIIALRLEYTHL